MHNRGRDDFVGRRAQIDGLRRTIESTHNRATVVLVTGEAGIGKSRLAGEGAALARAAGMRVVWGEAEPNAVQELALWHGVRRALGIAATADPNLAAEERRWEHLDILTAALSASGPTLVVLDDLHWADDESLWVLERLPRALAGAPVVVIATSREDTGVGRLDRLRQMCDVMVLEGLGVDQVGELAALRGHAGADAAALHGRTGGNPMFVRELLEAPHRNDMFDELLAPTIERLPPETTAVVELAAVAGSTTPLSVLAAAAGATLTAVSEHLALAVDATVLDEVTSDGVRFRHSLLRSAVLQRADITSAHRRLATAWATMPDGAASAASHRLHATEPSDRTDATQAVIDAQTAAADLAGRGQGSRAIALLRDGADLAARAGLVDLQLGALLDLADVHADRGEGDDACRVAESACALLSRTASAETRARAEFGAAMQHRPFQPDPERLRRVSAVVDALPSDSHRLRAIGCGRLAVVCGADPHYAADARRWATEAVAAARLSGSSVLVAQALLDQHIAPTTVAALDARAEAMAEVIAIGERFGRNELAIQGHQWLVSHHLNHGDFAAATRELHRAELLAALQPAPIWRYSVLVRRVTLAALSGDQATAELLVRDAADLGEGWMDDIGLWGFELAHLTMLADLFGAASPRLGELLTRLLGILERVPAPFLQVSFGYAALLSGNDHKARDVIERFLPTLDLVLGSLTGDALLRTLGELVARTGSTTHAPAMYDALLPFAGLLNVGNAASAGLPVDDLLGRLAGARGDWKAAVEHGRAAVAFSRRLGSPPLITACLHHLEIAIGHAEDPEPDVHAQDERPKPVATAGLVTASTTLIGSSAAHSSRSASMRLEPGRYTIESPLGAGTVPTSAGMSQLVRLLAAPNTEVSAVDLAGAADAPVTGDLGPALDATAKRAYRARLIELREELDRADAIGDSTRSERAQQEIDALLSELSRATGLGGRDRPMGATAERARINVVRSLKRAIATIDHVAPDLARHLEVSVHTGRFCVYRPEPAAALAWVIVDAASSPTVLRNEVPSPRNASKA